MLGEIVNATLAATTWAEVADHAVIGFCVIAGGAILLWFYLKVMK